MPWNAHARSTVTVGRVALAGSVIVAVLPVVVAGLRAVRRGWIPTWDRAILALRASDVLTRHPPLLGTWSTASDYGIVVNHPGPLQFQVLAPWVWLFGPSDGTALGVAALNALCIVGVTWLAGRRGGLLAALIATAVMASLVWSMGSETLYDPWQPNAVMLPFAVFLTAAWSTADNDLVALPVMVVSGSFVLQTHLGYVVLVPGVALISLGLLCWRVRSDRRDAARAGDSTRPWTARPAWWAMLAVAIGLVCWAPPLYEQVTGRYGGNLGSLVHAAAHPKSTEAAGRSTETASTDDAVRIVGGTLALPPWWFPPSFQSPAVGLYGEGVATRDAVAGLGLMGTVLAVGLVRAACRGHTTIATGLGLALAVIPLAIYTTDSAPMEVGFSALRLRYLWVVSAFIGMMLALAVVDELRLRRPAPGWAKTVASLGIAAVAVAAGVAAIPYADHNGTETNRGVAAANSLAAQLLPQVEGRGAVLVQVPSSMSFATWVGPGLLVAFRQAGVPFVVDDPILVRHLGHFRRYDGRNADLRLLVVPANASYRPRAAAPGRPTPRRVASVDGLTPAEEDELERLHDELRKAIVRAGGLPLELEAGALDDVPKAKDQITALIDAVKAVGDDPDDLLGSAELTHLVSAMGLGVIELDEVVDPDVIPTDDLLRFGQLNVWREERAIVAYLEELPRH